MKKINFKNQNAFTLVETIVGIAIVAIVIAGVLGTVTALNRVVKAAREKTVLASLASQYIETARNLPYSSIGTAHGNPQGTLPDQTTPVTTTIEDINYKIYYEVTYIDDPADGTILAGSDSAPDDYKQVKLSIQNTNTNSTTKFVTTIVPKGLEGIANAGALLLKVLDAQGQPVSGASLHIQKTDNSIILDRSTDSTGSWIEVGLPAGVNIYKVTATKSGYSTDSTYTITVPNPNPVKPDATIVNGQVTQITFAIDLQSNLTINTLNQTCGPISGINLNIKGAKLIGSSPNVLKFDTTFASSGGQISMNPAEWDTYTPTLLTGQGYIVFGTSPIQQINVLPNTTQTFNMILGASSGSSLLVIVKNSATGTALENANVHLSRPGSDYYGISGGSVWLQNNWTGGSGQGSFSDTTRYYQDSGTLDTTTLPTGLRLAKAGANYLASGWLESSTYDTGGSANFTTLSWLPTSQNPNTQVQFQIATNKDNTTWTYKGPDGTGSTYYTTPGSSINTIHDNDRYVRYKIFLSTTNNQYTPVITSISTNYVSGCNAPGQVIFPNLTTASNYTLDVSLAGYQTKTITNLNVNGNQVLEVKLSP